MGDHSYPLKKAVERVDNLCPNTQNISIIAKLPAR